MESEWRMPAATSHSSDQSLDTTSIFLLLGTLDAEWAGKERAVKYRLGGL
jgi:hypothetical protein